MVEFRDIKEGPGPTISLGDRISILYRVEALNRDGELVVFETNFDPDNEVIVQYAEGQLLHGLVSGMEGMRSGGGQRELLLTSNEAYGSRSFRNIPANTDLKVLISVIDIIDTMI